MKHPTPWKVSSHPSTSAPYECVYIDDVIRYAFTLPKWGARRIVKAVNAYESPVSKAERAVVRAAVRASKSELWADLNAVDDAVDRLLAARAKAEKGAR